MNLVNSNNQGGEIYETARSLGEYLLFHYGSEEEQFPWPGGPKDALDFARRSVEELIDTSMSIGQALDLGCAVGKSSFVLANISGQVLGIDYSESFIGAANSLVQSGSLSYQYHEDIQEHANIFANVLGKVIELYKNDEEKTRSRLQFQKMWTDNFYSWQNRVGEWEGLINGIIASKEAT